MKLKNVVCVAQGVFYFAVVCRSSKIFPFVDDKFKLVAHLDPNVYLPDIFNAFPTSYLFIPGLLRKLTKNFHLPCVLVALEKQRGQKFTSFPPLPVNSTAEQGLNLAHLHQG